MNEMAKDEITYATTTITTTTATTTIFKKYKHT